MLRDLHRCGVEEYAHERFLLTDTSLHGDRKQNEIGCIVAVTRQLDRTMRVAIGLVGTGRVGSALLHLIGRRRGSLENELGLELAVVGIANSTSMLLWNDVPEGQRIPFSLDGSRGRIPVDLESFEAHLCRERNSMLVIVDCTDSAEVSSRYEGWLQAGIHVVTPNKAAGSGDPDYYSRLRKSTAGHRARFGYETTVGAALPVLRTLRDLVHAGEAVQRVEGVLSGSLSFIFGHFDEGRKFSDLVSDAQRLGLTEPDPREDLRGLDVARKTVIIAREIGMSVSIEQVLLDLGPLGEIRTGGSLAEHDENMRDRIRASRLQGEVLRIVGEVDPATGCNVSLRSFDERHPFAVAKPGDNVVRINSSSYQEGPLVIQGTGAGPTVTATGILTDLLYLTRFV